MVFLQAMMTFSIYTCDFILLVHRDASNVRTDKNAIGGHRIPQVIEQLGRTAS